MSPSNEKPTPETEIVNLIEELKDSSGGEKSETFTKLIDFGEKAVLPLISVLNNKNNDYVFRLSTAYLLSQLNDVRATKAFVKAIESPQDLQREWFLMVNCAWGLGKFRNDAIAGFLFQMLILYREHLHGLSAFSGALEMQGERANQIVLAAATQNEDEAAKWAAFYHINMLINRHRDNLSEVDHDILLVALDETNNSVGKDSAITLATSYLKEFSTAKILNRE